MTTLSNCQKSSQYCSRQDDVVNGDKHELYKVANDTHHGEAHDAGLQNLHVLGVVWLLALVVEVD